MLDLAFLGIGDDFIQWPAFFYSRSADLALAARRIARAIDLGKVGREVVVLILRPALEGMVVALVAVEARGEEQMRRVLHQGFRRAERLEVCGCWVVLRRAA